MKSLPKKRIAGERERERQSGKRPLEVSRRRKTFAEGIEIELTRLLLTSRERLSLRKILRKFLWRHSEIGRIESADGKN